jgi:hypothetical protein
MPAMTGRRLLPRIGLAVVALVVLAWLGVLERDTRLQSQAAAASRAGDTATAEHKLRQARLLNPDTQPDVTRAVILASHGLYGPAIRVLDGVVAREPQNLVAWANLLFVAKGHDPARFRRALASARRLDPLGAPKG